MAVVFPYVKNASWADGSGGGTPITAAKLNVVEDGIFNIHQQPAVRAYHNATQSLTSGVDTALALNSERFDTAGGSGSTMHDLVTNNTRLTCRYAGKYLAVGHAEFASNATGLRSLFVRINATATQKIGHIWTPSTLLAGTTVSLTLTTLVDLAVNDYIELFATQTSGGALNVSASSATVQYGCEFMMHRVG